MATSKYKQNTFYHIVFTTKKRRKILIKPIKPRLDYWVNFFILKKNINLISYKSILDHCHLLIYINQEQTLEKVIQYIKGSVANMLFKEFIGMKLDLHTNNFWNRKYYANEISENQLIKVKKYIEKQEIIHARRLGWDKNIFYDI
jgi:putative transposase